MAVKLDKPLKRELEVNGVLHTITVAPEGVSIAQKGHRKHRFLSWETILSGDAELTRDLKISLDAFGDNESTK